jgi:hypothetical protein
MFFVNIAFSGIEGLAGVFFGHRSKKYMVDEVIKHRPKVLLHVFYQYNCTKNRGACVDGIIWLRHCYSVFDKYNCTKKQETCVEHIIWLLGII